MFLSLLPVLKARLFTRPASRRVSQSYLQFISGHSPDNCRINSEASPTKEP